MFTPARIRRSAAMAVAALLPPLECPAAPIRFGSIISECRQAGRGGGREPPSGRR